VLDHALVEAAVASGAEFRDRFTVDEYRREGEAVTGIRGKSSAGHAQANECARIVIGADGRHSSLARAVGAAIYDDVPTLTCWYFSYWSDAALDGLHVCVRGQNVIFAFPTNDSLTAVFIAWPLSELARVRASVESSFMEVLRRVPPVAGRICGGKREERFYGAADLPNFFRKPYGAGWALVGDAGHHKDPFIWRSAFAMLFAMRICSRRHSTKASPGNGRWRKLWPVTRGIGTALPQSSTGRILR
jgi:flavin-dependent dehydrogenase